MSASISCILDVIMPSCVLKVSDIMVAIFVFQFPYCDGAHGAHNKETGDNVGPICILRKNK